MLSSLPLDDQLSLLMRGVSFGDAHLQEVMTRELRERLIEAALFSFSAGKRFKIRSKSCLNQ